MKPWQGKAPLRRIGTAVLMIVFTAAFSATSARAAESTWPTAQATAANAEWIPYLEPPPKPAAICLVDSGVNITPDTPADSPDGPIVKRLALDGGTGEAAGTSWEALHGTRMAMVAGAPMNDWGTVGMWPGVRIVSVRAMPMGETTFPFGHYQESIRRCEQAAATYSIVAINLSLGCVCDYSPDQAGSLDNRIAHAHGLGINVIASAGNEAGPVLAPASEPGVFGVGASDMSGALCSFSGRGDGLDAAFPGCGMSLGDPESGVPWADYEGGTSAAAMQASTVIALIRAYRPDLRWSDAERIVEASEKASELPIGLDTEAVFRSAGLGDRVQTARARAAEHQPAMTVAVAGEGSPEANVVRTSPVDRRSENRGGTHIPRPKVRSAKWNAGRLRIAVSNRTNDWRLVVIAQVASGEFGLRPVARASAARSHIAMRLRHRPARVVIRFESVSESGGASASVERRV